MSDAQEVETEPRPGLPDHHLLGQANHLERVCARVGPECAAANQVAQEKPAQRAVEVFVYPGAHLPITSLVADIQPQQGMAKPALTGARFAELRLTGIVGSGQVPEAEAGVQIAAFGPDRGVIGPQRQGLAEGGMGVIPLQVFGIPASALEQGIGRLQSGELLPEFPSVVVRQARGRPFLIACILGVAPFQQDAAHANEDRQCQAGHQQGDRPVPAAPAPGTLEGSYRPGRDRLAGLKAAQVLRQGRGGRVTPGLVFLEALQADGFQVARDFALQP